MKKRILIADPCLSLCKSIKKSLPISTYSVEMAHSGTECLHKIDTFQPDLIILELMLPHIHGIEILRKLKQDPRTKQIGVILVSSNIMTQNYHAAIKLRCDDFLEKPLSLRTLLSHISQFFKGTLSPAPFEGTTSLHTGRQGYIPKSHFIHSYLKFWGTRGSNPVSGPDYLRFGGNTSCLEIRHEEDLIIVDAGTGIRPLGLEIQKTKQIHLLLSHTHWDHLAGFPFFAPLYDPECHITIWAPIGFEKSVQELFTEMLAYAYFPIRLDDIKAKISFKEIQEGVPFEIGSVTVNSHYAYHPGSTLCFKFRVGKVVFGYATDNEFLMGYHDHPKKITANHPQLLAYKSMIQFFKGSTFVVHEAQYTPHEYQQKVGWGHSSISNAAILMRYADIEHWILTHHDPKHTDLDLLKKIQLQHDILDEYKLPCRTRMAFDGMMLPL
jgi:CheY-like chemotaxis protein